MFWRVTSPMYRRQRFVLEAELGPNADAAGVIELGSPHLSLICR